MCKRNPLLGSVETARGKYFFLKPDFILLKVSCTALYFKKKITRVIGNKFPVSHSPCLTSRRQLFVTLVAVPVSLWPPTSKSHVTFDFFCFRFYLLSSQVGDADLVLVYSLLTTHSGFPSSHPSNIIVLQFLVSSAVFSIYIIITF